MNKTDFIKESFIHIEDSYKEFCDYQDITWDILTHVNKLFRENDLDYYLAYGTLLGVIRDKTKIPWDYDVDIHVKYKDYDKLIDILEHKLGPDYYYVYKNNMSDYPVECLRICKKGYTYTSIHVDVFFLFGGGPNVEDRVRTMKGVKKWCYIRSGKFVNNHHPLPPMSSLKRILLNLFNLRYKLIPTSLISQKEDNILKRYNMDHTEFYISFSREVNWAKGEFEVYPSTIFCSSIDIEIDGVLYKAPAGYDEYLRLQYGDYMSYLPIKNRFREFYNQLDRIKERQAYFEKYLQHKIK